MKIAVTGATGFVGRALCPYLSSQAGAEVITINRRSQTGAPSFDASDLELIATLRGVDCLVHLAARAHNREATAEDFERDNQQLSRRIANIAMSVGISRFIYLSSIKVNGESTNKRAPFSPDETPAPEDEYGRSKCASEAILRTIFANSDIELVIIRPPLIYGADNKGNLAALQRLIKGNVPLPFASVSNQRDLLSITNLCSFIALCCTHPAAANETFLVSDGISRSTADIVKLLAAQAHLTARLFSVPSTMFSVLGLFKPDMIARLTGDLQVDISKSKQLLGWSPEQP